MAAIATPERPAPLQGHVPVGEGAEGGAQEAVEVVEEVVAVTPARRARRAAIPPSAWISALFAVATVMVHTVT